MLLLDKDLTIIRSILLWSLAKLWDKDDINLAGYI